MLTADAPVKSSKALEDAIVQLSRATDARGTPVKLPRKGSPMNATAVAQELSDLATDLAPDGVLSIQGSHGAPNRTGANACVHLGLLAMVLREHLMLGNLP